MNKRKSLLYAALACTLVLALAQYLSFQFYLSWTFWWFDILMHYFAGVTGGLATYWVLFHSGLLFKEIPTKKQAISLTLILLLVVGVAWEVAEQVMGITDSNEGHVLDVIIDLIMDALGAVSATLIALRRSHDSLKSP